MGKALIIAEKPSVALDISKALGGFKKVDDHYESDTHIIASAVGHLLELAVPEEFEIKRGRWTFNALPHLPPRFALNPIEKSESKLRTLSKLIKRKDVDRLINACDAGREGELIFRNIANFTGAKQPIQRLWLQSMTPGAIRDGFQHLRSDAELRPLADASICRSESDWLVGINGTRAMTAFNNKTGGFNKTTVGRVQTPTLAVVVEREAKIRKFVPRNYWEVVGTFDAQAGTYSGRWFDETFRRSDAKDADAELKAERLWAKPDADAIQARCLGKAGVVTEETKPSTQLSPLLFDLTSLQREANGRFGFSAKTTLSLAQALYERHKVLTYPRTDSRALPEDYLGTARSTLQTLSGFNAYQLFADRILKEGWVRPNKRVFNNDKISDHFAIIPTTQEPRGLTDAEQKIYDLVTKRFLAVFYPPAEFLETTRITRVQQDAFKSTGKVLMKAGWLEIYGKEVAGDDNTPMLVPIQQGEPVKTTGIEVKPFVTKPPPRYNEATLLSAMEGAGKLIEDDELREAMAQKGLGTPATRASIIEGLIDEQYILRNGRELMPTAKAFSLMTLLNGLGVETLTKPELTGNWESKLKQMERGQLSRDVFMEEIRELTRDIVTKAKSYDHDTIPGDFGVLTTPCPKCGGEVHETYKKFECKSCDFALWKIMGSRQFEPQEIEELINQKQLGPLQGFRSKIGKPFAAIIRLTPEFRAEFDFGDDNKSEDGEGGAEVDFTGKEPLGACPKCAGRVFENGMNYVCENAVGKAKKCDFKTGAVILQQAIDKTQIAKLLSTGKTDLLKSFVSKKNGRKFEAFLTLKAGDVKFEFAPRERKAGAKTNEDAAPEVKLDFSTLTPIGKCPKCGSKVYEGPESYLCERSQAAFKKCTFKFARNLLQQPVEREQAIKLLTDGRTDILTKFVSNKTGKPFSAHLVIEPTKSKVEFEFPPR